MSKDSQHMDYELVAKYLADEASDDEKQELENWIELSDENEQRYEELKRLWANSSGHEPADVNVDAAWKKFKAKRSGETDKKEAKVIPLKYYLTRVAAVLLIGVLIYFIYAKLTTPEITQQTITADIQVETDTLNDGSVVTLNTNTQLSFASNFGQADRKIKLKGEAFFDVKSDASKPFTIDAGMATVTVLGTSFYVKAYDSLNLFEVGVAEGKVEVSGTGGTVTLTAGEKITLDRNTQTMADVAAYNANDIFWKSQTLVFTDQPLSAVFDRLKQAYNVDIVVYNQAILNCRLSAKFQKDPLDQVLQIIRTNFNINWEYLDDRYVITGKGCE